MSEAVKFLTYHLGMSVENAQALLIMAVSLIGFAVVALALWLLTRGRKQSFKDEAQKLPTNKSIGLVQRCMEAAKFNDWEAAYKFWYMQGRPTREQIDLSPYANNTEREKRAQLALDGLFHEIHERESVFMPHNANGWSPGG